MTKRWIILFMLALFIGAPVAMATAPPPAEYCSRGNSPFACHCIEWIVWGKICRKWHY